MVNPLANMGSMTTSKCLRTCDTRLTQPGQISQQATPSGRYFFHLMADFSQPIL